MKNKNSISLNIGGQERVLKFGMDTLEMFMSPDKKVLGTDNKLDLENPFTRMKVLFYYALICGAKENELPKVFSPKIVGEWIDDCEDENFEDANEMAITAMGFIEQAEEKDFGRKMNQLKSMGKNPSEIVDKALSENTALANS